MGKRSEQFLILIKILVSKYPACYNYLNSFVIGGTP